MSTTDNSQFLSTQTEHSTTILTVTSCSNDVCTETAITTGVTVVTEDETIYTTYCPLTDESTPVEESTSANTSSLLASTTDKEFIHQHDKSSLVSNGNALSTETEKLTTVITVTSCSNDACSETPITTGVRVVTSDETTYTTYCPLSSYSDIASVEENVSSVSTLIETPAAYCEGAECDTTSTVTDFKTIVIDTEGTVPTTVEFVSLIPVSSLAEPSTVVAITTFEGAANNMRLPVGAAILGLVAMMV